MVPIQDIPAIRALIDSEEAPASDAQPAKALETKYARAPAGPGYQPGARPSPIKRSNP